MKTDTTFDWYRNLEWPWTAWGPLRRAICGTSASIISVFTRRRHCAKLYSPLYLGFQLFFCS